MKEYKVKKVRVKKVKSKSKKSKSKSSKKWSESYKKKIDCNNPKGFSQRQYCLYGRK